MVYQMPPPLLITRVGVDSLTIIVPTSKIFGNPQKSQSEVFPKRRSSVSNESLGIQLSQWFLALNPFVFFQISEAKCLEKYGKKLDQKYQAARHWKSRKVVTSMPCWENPLISGTLKLRGRKNLWKYDPFTPKGNASSILIIDFQWLLLLVSDKSIFGKEWLWKKKRYCLRIHGTGIFIPTWVVDLYGK